MKIQIFRFERPHPIIHEVRTIQSDNTADTLTHIVPPMGHPEIVFYVGNKNQIKNTTCERGFIKGQYKTVQKVDFNPGYHFVSISLHPFGLKQLFNVNASELIDSIVNVNEHPVTERLFECIRDTNVIDKATVKLLAGTITRFPTHTISRATTDFIHGVDGGQNTVNDIIDSKGIGIRTLQRNFKSEVGLAPKEFLQIVRMTRVERQMKEVTDLYQIIADFDFTDQSHFTKEVKQWRNVPPGELVRKKLLLSDQLAPPDYIQL